MVDLEKKENPTRGTGWRRRPFVVLAALGVGVVAASVLTLSLVRNTNDSSKLALPSEQADPAPSENADISGQNRDSETIRKSNPNASRIEDDDSREVSIDSLDVVDGEGSDQARQTMAAEVEAANADRRPVPGEAAPKAVVRERSVEGTEDFVPPSFDVVTISPGGETVIAGRGEPNSKITLRDGEEELGTVETDSTGTWVFVPDEPLSEGVRELDLLTKTPEGIEVNSGEVVVLMLPSHNVEHEIAANDGKPAIPLAVLLSREDGGSAKLLQGKEPIHGLIASESLTLDILNYDASGQIDFSGQGKPDTRISAYIDNELIGITTVMPDGTWTLLPSDQVAPGLHTLRIDQVDELTGQVISRLETPFSMASFERPMSGEGLVIVQPGNSLWRIARRLYGQGIRYTMIFAANQDQIRNPALIYPGQIFVVPSEG